MSSAAGKHEEEAIKSFVVHAKQERLLSFVSNPKNRRKFTHELANRGVIDKRFATSVPWKVDPTLELWARRFQGIATIAQMLRSKGAGPTCWVISENPSLDGREMELQPILEEVVGKRQCDYLVMCLPGKLAYFNDEHESLLLER